MLGSGKGQDDLGAYKGPYFMTPIDFCLVSNVNYVYLISCLVEINLNKLVTYDEEQRASLSAVETTGESVSGRDNWRVVSGRNNWRVCRGRKNWRVYQLSAKLMLTAPVHWSGFKCSSWWTRMELAFHMVPINLKTQIFFSWNALHLRYLFLNQPLKSLYANNNWVRNKLLWNESCYVCFTHQ